MISPKPRDSPPGKYIPGIFVWYEILQRGGKVRREELYEICRTYKYNTRGVSGFFKGKNPSMEYVDENTVVLKEKARQIVEEYESWIEENREKYVSGSCERDVLKAIELKKKKYERWKERHKKKEVSQRRQFLKVALD